jgi:pteridine reductase
MPSEHPSSTPVAARVALITGSAARIGAALAAALHARGYNVVIHYNRSESQASALAAALNAQRSGSAVTVQADLLDTQAVLQLARTALSAWGRMDVLVNNASAFYPTPLASLQEDDWISLMRSNAKAPLFLCKELEAELRSSSGCIVNIVDSTAMHGLNGFSPYAMAKAALANMTRSLAKELAPAVRVNGVSPGIILWPDYDELSEEQKADAVQHTALQRMGGVDDITNTALFLIRDATYLTGQIIRVDGGAALATP